MWVYLNVGGCKQKDVWDEVAKLVGGRVVQGPSSNTYQLVPDYTEVSRRCLASLEYYGNGMELFDPSRTRGDARLEFFRSLTAEQWKQVIDATFDKPILLPLLKGSKLEKIAHDLYENLRKSDNQSIRDRLPDKPVIQVEIGSSLYFSFTFVDKNGQKSHL